MSEDGGSANDLGPIGAAVYMFPFSVAGAAAARDLLALVLGYGGPLGPGWVAALAGDAIRALGEENRT